jgi:hypothetical protein
MKSQIILAAAIALAAHVQCAQVVAPRGPAPNVRNLLSVQGLFIPNSSGFLIGFLLSQNPSCQFY